MKYKYLFYYLLVFIVAFSFMPISQTLFNIVMFTIPFVWFPLLASLIIKQMERAGKIEKNKFHYPYFSFHRFMLFDYRD